MDRMQVTVTFEYDVDPDAYPGVTDPKARAEIDRENYQNRTDIRIEDLIDLSYEVSVHPVR
jgi:hypothetical protein